ncbi:MAG: DUF2797 domain-containing protein [Myxococcota bacterium]
MDNRALVVGFTWVDGGVRLRSWTGEPPALEVRPLAGALSFRILPGRHCTGRSDGSTLRMCPDRALATRGSTCEACAARDAFRPCMMCDGTRCPRLTPEMQRYCRQPHHLYLACFGDTTIKVGTASDPRRTQRIIEQGPLAAARVAVAPGPTIKQIEHLLAEAGFSETMRRARKTVLIRTSMTEPEARALVEDAASGLPDVLPRGYHAHLHPPQFVEQPAFARESRTRPVNELRIEDDRVVEGTIVGAVGHVVFVEDRDGCFALDLGELKGRRIEWDPVGPRRRPVAQLGLF